MTALEGETAAEICTDDLQQTSKRADGDSVKRNEKSAHRISRYNVNDLASKLNRTLRQRQVVGSEAQDQASELNTAIIDVDDSMSRTFIDDAGADAVGPVMSRRKGRPRKFIDVALSTPSVLDENQHQPYGTSPEEAKTSPLIAQKEKLEDQSLNKDSLLPMPELTTTAVTPPEQEVTEGSNRKPFFLAKVHLQRLRLRQTEEAVRRAALKFADGRLIRRARQSREVTSS
ncbi:hypothetical protein BIW11_10774, partial [Tropilaelaps mercedesae]